MGKMNIKRTVINHFPFFEAEDVITCVGGVSAKLGSSDGCFVVDVGTGLEEGAKEFNPFVVG